MNKIYQIKLLDKDNLSNDIINSFFSEIVMVISIEDANNIGFSNEDDIFIRLDKYKFDKFLNILSKYFKFTVKDVSYKALSGELKKIYPEVDKLNPNFFKKFRKDNITINHILDKISEKGIKSLDKTEIEILKQKDTYF